jgi:glycerol-3-phosphate dehydrogenase (NAD(P)+)
MSPPHTIAVLGGGAWGTALATVIAANGQAPILWARSAETVAAINTSHRNQAYLPDIALPASLRATTDLRQTVEQASLILAVTPAQTTRGMLAEIAPYLADNAMLVLCAKGIDAQSGRFLSDLARQALPGARVAVLSGPGFAAEVARGLPTAVTVAAADLDAALTLATHLSGPTLRCYASDDMTGVEAGGALKNVIAIAAGAAHGAGLGASASAALVTRGFAEIKRLALAFGGRAETLNGLSGLGDLILTCTSAQSRNFAFGAALATGQQTARLAEGAATAHIGADLARARGLDAPIIAAVSALISGQTTITDAVAALMARPLKAEQE